MRPFSITTAESGTGAAPVPSISVAPTMARIGRDCRESLSKCPRARHAVGASASDEVSQGAFVAVADGLEVVELGVGSDGGNEVAVGVEPESFAPPDQAFDRYSGRAFRLWLADVNRVLSAWLDSRRSAGQRRELCGRSMRGPVAHHEHLHGGRARIRR